MLIGFYVKKMFHVKQFLPTCILARLTNIQPKNGVNQALPPSEDVFGSKLGCSPRY